MNNLGSFYFNYVTFTLCFDIEVGWGGRRGEGVAAMRWPRWGWRLDSSRESGFFVFVSPTFRQSEIVGSISFHRISRLSS